MSNYLTWWFCRNHFVRFMAVKTIYHQDKMVHIFQTTILITFSSRKMFVFLFKFLRVQFTIRRNWFRWLANFSQWWLRYLLKVKLPSGDCHWTSLMEVIKPIKIQVMDWCHQPKSHYACPCRPNSMSPYLICLSKMALLHIKKNITMANTHPLLQGYVANH